MKSYFSRFLHHTMSHSGIREVFTSSLSLSDLIGESRSNKVANLFHLDYRVKPEYDNICAGRSMVEMLGVLAIIGVLSVGAIAGYSKAMTKYKLNKHAEQMNTVINAVARNAHSFGNIEGGRNIVPYFIKMGEIPQEMIKSGDANHIFDIFGQSWRIFTNSDNSTIFLATDGNSLSTSSTDNLAICQNTLTVAKENAANIHYVATVSNYNTENSIVKMLRGDSSCDKQSSIKCLKDMNMNDIYDICTAHRGVKEAIQFQIVWKK